MQMIIQIHPGGTVTDFHELEEMLALEAQMLSEGKTQAEVDEYMLGLRQIGFDIETQKMRDAGMPEEEIAAFWEAMSSITDVEADDAYSAED